MKRTCQNGESVSTGADLDSAYAFPAESAPDRSAETWKAAAEEQKARGFNPKSNVGDGGSGPVKGAGKAFPEAETRPDIFRAPQDLGRQVPSAERGESKRPKKLRELKNRMETAKTYPPTRREYDSLRKTTLPRPVKPESPRILFDRPGDMRLPAVMGMLKVSTFAGGFLSGIIFKRKSGVSANVSRICPLSRRAFNALCVRRSPLSALRTSPFLYIISSAGAELP